MFSCSTCRLVQSEGVEHCLQCEACIHEVEFHCKWVSKCVTKKNLFEYYAYLISMVVFLGASVGTLLTGVLAKQME